MHCLHQPISPNCRNFHPVLGLQREYPSWSFWAQSTSKDSEPWKVSMHHSDQKLFCLNWYSFLPHMHPYLTWVIRPALMSDKMSSRADALRAPTRFWARSLMVRPLFYASGRLLVVVVVLYQCATSKLTTKTHGRRPSIFRVGVFSMKSVWCLRLIRNSAKNLEL